MVHCNRTEVVLLHKHFSSWLRTFINSVSIIMNCMHASITSYVNGSFTLFKSAYYV